MKSVMLSINPFWCQKIGSGLKTIEVRKTRPRIDTPFKCYIYCTKKGRPLVWGDVFRGGEFVTEFVQTHGYSKENAERIWDVFNGSVCGEFICDRIECSADPAGGLVDVVTEKQSCMSAKEIIQYADGDLLYFWHISQLKIYDSPIGLQSFMLPCNEELDKEGFPPCEKCEYSVQFYGCKKTLLRPPQSWCYVDDADGDE